ncbi:MAG: carboxylating nicotinate-nucleotide diphosphorylase [Promethearchaeota archaeon]
MGTNETLRLNPIQRRLLIRQLHAMLEEDLGFGDITTQALIAPTQWAQARFVSRQSGVVAGTEIVAEFLGSLGFELVRYLSDGTPIDENSTILEVPGPAPSLLALERPLLNLLMRMSGIATLTAAMVTAARKANPNVRVAATRKTAPLLRVFDKLAVIAGGGDPHRWRLDDAVLIKDNHLAVTDNITQTIKTVRQKVSFTKLIEIEVHTPKDAVTAARAGADAILLDNMTPTLVSKAVTAIKKLKLTKPPTLEASGNITLDNVAKYAATGVDVISAGALTHSVKALDLSVDLIPFTSFPGKGGFPSE